MRAFVFKKELMQDHFNRYYIESDRYPQAHFTGIIEKFDFKNLPQTPTSYQIKGKLKIHGRTKNISIKAVLQKTKMGIVLDSQFDLNTEDYGIVIPNVIIAKVSKTVATQLHFVLN
jgi:polyisoprenoid-binding protein YceI